MADENKAKSAKARLEAAKRAAEEAEFVDAPDDAAQAGSLADTDEVKSDEAEPTEAGAPDAPPADTGGVDPAVDDEAATEPGLSDEGEAGDAADHEDAPAAPDAPEGDPPTDDPHDDAPDDDRHDHMAHGDEPPDDEQRGDEPHEDAPAGRSLASLALTYIGVLVAGMALALWAGPRIAPNLPQWAAPAARFLTPGVNQATARIDAVEIEAQARLAALSARLDTVAGSAGDKALARAGAVENRLIGVEAALNDKIDAIAAGPRADLARMDDLARRLAKLETSASGLRAEVDALAGFSGENAAPSAETLERVAAFGAAVEGLRAQIETLRGQAAAIEGKADAAEVENIDRRLAALESGEAATTGARAEADLIRRDAGVDAALTEIAAALRAGGPFDAALSQAETLSGKPAPAILEAAASAGLPTADALARAFPEAAQEAYAAALLETAGDGFTAQAMAKLQGRLGGRPAAETDGDDAGAVLSRIEARLNEGRPDAALDEAAGLSDAARAALGGWYDDLKAHVAASAAYSGYASTLDQG